MLIAEQMVKNKSFEDVMIVATFTEYLLCTEPYPRHEKKHKKTYSLCPKTLLFSYPVAWE